jgi:hypothetical protein
MTDLTETRRLLWLCIWPVESGKPRFSLHAEKPDATGALAVLQVRGDMADNGPLLFEGS